MAKFKFLAADHSKVKSSKPAKIGGLLEIRVPLQAGGVQVFLAKDPVRGFQPGEVLNAEITDSRALQSLRIDPRFVEV